MEKIVYVCIMVQRAWKDRLITEVHTVKHLHWWRGLKLQYHPSHGGRVVTLSSPTSEAGVWFPARPQVGKLVVACVVGRQFTVQSPDELYVLISSALPTTRCDTTCTVLKVT